MVRRLGPRWVLWRAGYALRSHSGLLKRRFRPVDFDSVRLADLVRDGTPTTPPAYREFRTRSPVRFPFTPGNPPTAASLESVLTRTGRDRLLAVADDYCRGHFLYYSRHVHDLGRPVDWLLNPFTGGRHEARVHWCDYPLFSQAAGDIKDVWEPSRFACTFWLVRAYALTRNERYPRAFWEMFESWCRANPPHRGPNWKSGQETALRSLAWCFALYGFWNSPATTAERVVSMVRMLALHADRVARNIGFAVSQKNNHALSEAVGILTVGLLFPELKDSCRWLRTGRRVLEREVHRQIYDDGSYVQQSMNYHRVMLHDCLWAIRLAELNGQPLSEALIDRVAKAGQFLFQMLDADSGGVPNYGANDGALVLPLTSCDYVDYRPTVQVAMRQATGGCALPEGPWDEMALWLYGSREANRADATAGSSRFDAGGYYTLRGPDSWCMIRCHRYRDRPGHVDPLHVDLWYKGVNVLGDSGTYKYFVPDDPAFERYYQDIGSHNTIEIDGRGPLDRASRFLWLPWPGARCLDFGRDSFRGEHYGYARPPWNVVHRRTVRRMDDRAWEVVDELQGGAEHHVCLRWQLADGAFRRDAGGDRVEVDLSCGTALLSFDKPAGIVVAVHRGVRRPDKVCGWTSEYYGECSPRPTVELSGRSTLPVRLVTRISLRDT